MTVERLRARLIRRIVFLEATQDVLGLCQGVCQVSANLFLNLATTAKIAELDAAKQYQALTGQAIHEGHSALRAVQTRDDDD